MRLVAWLVLVALGSPALAEDKADIVSLPVDDPAPGEPAADAPLPLADKAAEETPSEGIFAWVDRLEGEVLSPEALEALQERAQAQLAEGALEDALGTPDVPTEVYADPVAAVTTDPLRLDEIDPETFDIPVEVNGDVKRWMRYFLGNGRRHFERYLGRMHTYAPMMRAKLREAGLPEHLVYLSMIESGFNSHALSHAGAGGLWQFMPATGRMYDLRVDWWVDDRRDPLKATDAAVAHLADLHKMFDGNWLLAWSAYNAGPGRVRGAMRRGGTDDFWALAKAGHLPRETANYPPKMMAAAILAENAERYGFTYTPQPELAVEVVRVDGAANLEILAECAGVDVETLKHLNPGLRRYATPAEGYALNVPAGRGQAFAAAFAKVPAEQRVRYASHVVRRGDTLGGIASQHGTTVDAIVSANHLRDANRIVVGMSLLIPRLGGARPAAAAAAVAPTERPASHTVAAGEALSVIARRYGCSTADLRTWNGLSDDVIHPGQVLKLSAPDVPAGPRTTRYTVRRGDTLSGIAARYGVKVSELQAWNGLSASTIRVGQSLEIRRAAWRTVEVSAGDSLGRIASREGCSVDDLRSWNDLSGDVIHPGQVLRIRR